MIYFDKREIVTILTDRISRELKISENLILNFQFDKITSYLKIEILYKKEVINNINFFCSKVITKALNEIFLRINFLFNSFIRFSKKANDYDDNEILHLSSYLSFLHQKQLIIKNNNLLVNSFGNVTIVSVEYLSNNREIILLFLDEDKNIQSYSDALYDFDNNKFKIYNPYEFILDNLLFYGTPKYNELATELTYLLTE